MYFVKTLRIDGEERECEICAEYQPEEGDGWNEPRYEECFQVYSIKCTRDGTEFVDYLDEKRISEIEEMALYIYQNKEY